MMAKLPYPEMNLSRLMNQLTHTLVQWDQADSRREARRGHVNIYRMGNLLKAKERVEDDAAALVRDGWVEREAFIRATMNHFTPSPRIRTLLRKIDPTVDVKYGRWTLGGEIYR